MTHDAPELNPTDSSNRPSAPLTASNPHPPSRPATPGETPEHPRSRWRSIRFAMKAVEIRLRFIVALVGIGSLIGYWDTVRNHWDKWTRPTTAAAAVAKSGTEFYCPMHPNVVRPTLEANGSIPSCPICGMPLSKRKKGEAPQLPAGITGRVQLSPERIRMAGVRTVSVAYRPLMKHIRTVGYVAYDESRLSKIVTRFGGYVEKLYVDKTFQTVKRDEPLAAIYSPELYAAVQELLISHENGSRKLVQLCHEKLRLLGISEREIQEIHKKNKASSRLVIRSPRQGYVIRKAIVDGSRITKGMTLFEIADLSTVWIEADVFEKDVPFLRPGQKIEATVESFPGRTFRGKVSLIYPELNRSTRTNRVRFELNNGDEKLRPGMFANVRLDVPVAQIKPFSERSVARHSSAPMTDVDRIADQKICPVTGAKLGSMGTPIKQMVGKRTIFLCCKGCIAPVQESPEKYLKRIAPAPADSVVAVPREAVIDTGSQKIVYVEREPGLFEGVAVKVGPRSGRYYPIICGVLPGDRIAAAGAFLIDAETRLNPAAASSYFGASGSPKSERPKSSTPAARPQRIPRSPSADPGMLPEVAQALNKLSPGDRRLARLQKICPVTGEPLGSMGKPAKLSVQGQTVFICCPGCEEAIRQKPDEYLAKLKQSLQPSKAKQTSSTEREGLLR